MHQPPVRSTDWHNLEETRERDWLDQWAQGHLDANTLQPAIQSGTWRVWPKGETYVPFLAGSIR
jgi:hypothetical protein